MWPILGITTIWACQLSPLNGPAWKKPKKYELLFFLKSPWAGLVQLCWVSVNLWTGFGQFMPSPSMPSLSKLGARSTTLIYTYLFIYILYVKLPRGIKTENYIDLECLDAEDLEKTFSVYKLEQPTFISTFFFFSKPKPLGRHLFDPFGYGHIHIRA